MMTNTSNVDRLYESELAQLAEQIAYLTIKLVYYDRTKEDLEKMKDLDLVVDLISVNFEKPQPQVIEDLVAMLDTLDLNDAFTALELKTNNKLN